MSLFSMQELHCTICGVKFETDFNGRGGYGRDVACCSKKCYDERKWRRALANMGKPYRP